VTGLRVPGACDLGTGDLALRRVVEGEPVAGEQAVQVDGPLDPFVVRAGRRCEQPLAHRIDEPVRREGQPFVTHAGRRRDQRQRSDARRVIEREELRDRAAHRVADDVGRRDAERIEDAHRVAHEILEQVGRIRVDLGRASAVAVLEPNDPATGGDERGHERIGPAEHRSVGATEQEHGG
jgi:hypothetical protein